MKAPKPTPLNARAMRYMAQSMAMAKPTADQGENWVLGHLATFAAAEVRRYRKAIRRRLDAAIVSIDGSSGKLLKARDRAPFKAGALWAVWGIRKDLHEVQLVTPKPKEREGHA